MTADAAPLPTAERAVLLVRPPWRWLPVTQLVLLALFLLTLFLPFVTEHHYSWFSKEEYVEPPKTFTGWEIVFKSWPLWPLLAMVVVFVIKDAARPVGRRSALHAVGLELLRLHIVFGTLMLLCLWPFLRFFVTIDREVGSWGLVLLGAVALLQWASMMRYGGLTILVRQWIRRPPWRRWNRWLFPAAALNLLVAVAGMGLVACSLFVNAMQMARQKGPSAMLATSWFWAMVGGSAWVFLHFTLVGIVALAFWERQSWATWLYALLMAPLLYLVGQIFVGAAPSGDPAAAIAVGIGLFLGFLAIYTLAVAMRFSPGGLQRGRCGECGQLRWVRAATCDVCSERVLLHKDYAGAPVCLACGHEQPAAVPVCRQCRRAPRPPLGAAETESSESSDVQSP